MEAEIGEREKRGRVMEREGKRNTGRERERGRLIISVFRIVEAKMGETEIE
jgi:hypothetical protein